MTPLPGTSFSAAVVSVTNSAGGRAVDWQDDSCGSAPGLANAATLAAGLTPNIGDSVIIVQVTYGYSFVSHTLLASTMPLSRIVYARPRSGHAVAHG